MPSSSKSLTSCPEGQGVLHSAGAAWYWLAAAHGGALALLTSTSTTCGAQKMLFQ